MQPTKDFYYVIEDENGLSWYYDNGALQRRNQWTNLPHDPDGWQDIEFSFETNSNLLLSRSVATPFKFVREGADLLRELMYVRGEGINTQAYLSIYQKRWDKDVYSKIYRGKLDFTTFKDEIGISVSINTAEGGLLSYLEANSDVTYDVVCSENSPKWVKVWFDGVTLFDKYNYNIYSQDSIVLNDLTYAQVIGAVFLTHEGDSVGVINGSPTPMEVNSINNQHSVDTTYAALDTTADYLLESTAAIDVNASISITGRADARQLLTFSLFTKSTITQIQQIKVGAYDFVFPITNTDSSPFTQDFNFTWAGTIHMQDNDKLFLVVTVGATASVYPKFTLQETTMNLQFNSKNVPTTAYALRPVDLGQSLLDKLTGEPGKYIFKSDFLTTNSNIVTTCGDALRNTDKTSIDSAIKEYYISYTLQQFFNDYSLVPMALQATGNVLRMDAISDIYGGTDDIFSMGEVSEGTIEPLKDRLINSLKIGSPDQNYEERAGKYEFNSEETWKMPTDAVKKEDNRITHARTDYIGIEIIRSNYTGKDSTDNEGDKTPFMVMIDNTTGAPFYQISIADGINTSTFTILNAGVPDAASAKRFVVNGTFSLRYSLFNDGIYKVISVSGAVVTAEWAGRQPKTITKEAVVMQVTFDNYGLYREQYTSLTGVLDNTIFNVPLSPKHRLLGWGSYYNSIFYQQPTDQITLTAATKNKNLMYVKSGVAFSESAPITIGTLPPPLFLPYLFSFKTPVLFTFLETMANLQKGVVHVVYQGRDVYLMPIGKMSMKPATNEAQDWQLYISPLTSLMTLLALSNTGQVIELNNNSMYVSDLQPIHWIKYNYQKKTGIQQLQPHQDWVKNRFPNFQTAEPYYQKWMNTDTIKVWFITKGIANLALYVYNANAEVFKTYTLSTLGEAAIQAPNLIKYCSIAPNDLPAGYYLFVIQSGTQAVLISEWQKVSTYNAAHNDGTAIIKYTHSYNKHDYYQSLGELQLRVECAQGIPDYKGELVDYVDDQRTTVALNGQTYTETPYTFGFPRGLPEWMQKKLNLLTVLNTLSIEDVGVVRGADAQFDVIKVPGYNLVYSSISLLPLDSSGITIDEVTGDETSDDNIIILIDPAGFGNDSDIITAEVNG